MYQLEIFIKEKKINVYIKLDWLSLYCLQSLHYKQSQERKDEIEKLKPRFLIFDEIFKSINFKKQEARKNKTKTLREIKSL